MRSNLTSLFPVTVFDGWKYIVLCASLFLCGSVIGAAVTYLILQWM